MEDSTKWTNKQKTLVVGSKGMLRIQKQLVLDLCSIIPQSKRETKVEKDQQISLIKELTMLHGCNNSLYFETRKGNLSMWIGKYPGGPSAKFLIRDSKLFM